MLLQSARSALGARLCCHSHWGYCAIDCQKQELPLAQAGLFLRFTPLYMRAMAAQ